MAAQEGKPWHEIVRDRLKGKPVPRVAYVPERFMRGMGTKG